MNVGQTSRRPSPDLLGLPNSFLPGFLKGPYSAQNAYIIRTKCDQKRKCHFFNGSATATYDFSGSKCTHFPFPPLPHLDCNPNPNPLSQLTPFRPVEFVVSNGKPTKTDVCRPNLRGPYC